MKASMAEIKGVHNTNIQFIRWEGMAYYACRSRPSFFAFLLLGLQKVSCLWDIPRFHPQGVRRLKWDISRSVCVSFSSELKLARFIHCKGEIYFLHESSSLALAIFWPFSLSLFSGKANGTIDIPSRKTKRGWSASLKWQCILFKTNWPPDSKHELRGEEQLQPLTRNLKVQLKIGVFDLILKGPLSKIYRTVYAWYLNVERSPDDVKCLACSYQWMGEIPPHFSSPIPSGFWDQEKWQKVLDTTGRN